MRMAGRPALVVFVGVLTVLALAVEIGESRVLHRTKRVALFDPIALCEHATQYKMLCEKIAKGSKITSAANLVEANVVAAIKSARKASAQVTSLMKTTSEDYKGIMGSALQSCKENYDSTIDALQHTQTLLNNKGNHDDLMTQLSSASTFVTSCKDALDEVPEVSYPPEKTHTLLDKLVTNSLDLGANLNSHTHNLNL